MAVNTSAYRTLVERLQVKNVTLVAVSKLKTQADIMVLYNLGHRDFGENYVQELADKHDSLPKDIRWHFIGHLQTNKVKVIAPFVHLIHGVDSIKLLREIDKQGGKNNRVIDVLLQVHIAAEETKFGLNEQELEELVAGVIALPLQHTKIRGLMGMASFSEVEEKVRKEFAHLRVLSDKFRHQQIVTIDTEVLSMGMSNDFEVAMDEGSTMVRIGSLLFGARG